MAKFRMTQVRGFFAAVAAIVILIVFCAIAASVLGMDIPVLRDIASKLGFS